MTQVTPIQTGAGKDTRVPNKAMVCLSTAKTVYGRMFITSLYGQENCDATSPVLANVAQLGLLVS